MRRLIILVLIFAGALEAWARRHNMAVDGMSYLDIASAYRRGDAANAINEYWSPLFSWLLSLTVLFKNPNASLDEPARVHALMFVLYLSGLAATAFAIREARRFAESQPRDEQAEPLPAPWWDVVGYALFAWSSLELISLETVNPDILVSVIVIATFGLFFRVARGDTRATTALLLGLALGIAYLAKAVMFVIGLASLAALAVLYLRHLPTRRAVRNAAIAGLAFVAVAGTWIAILSRAKGHLTWGSSGKLNYGWLVDGVPICCWQGGYGAGTPLHPPRQIFQSPPMFEFATPIRGTFPLWLKPSYWYAGLRPPFHPLSQTWIALQNLGAYLFDFGWVIALIIAAAGFAVRGQLRIADWRYWTLFAVALVPFALYDLVYVETRYLGGSAVALCLVLFAGIRGVGHTGRSALRALALAFTIFAAAYAGFRLLGDARFIALNVASNNAEENVSTRRGNPPHQAPHMAIAAALPSLGVTPGTTLATIGFGNTDYWARLAGLRITVELQAREQFWGRPELRPQIFEAMRKAGAQFVVCDDPPGWADTRGWRKVGNTNAVVYDLRTN